MGSIKISALDDASIISRYVGGESRTMIALRCKMPDAYVIEVLTLHGIPLRRPSEIRALVSEQRAVTMARLEQRHGRRRRHQGG
jgi:hypothetical protein